MCRGRLECLLRFQSTLPRRERLSFLLVFHHPAYDFNPRSREGSDFKSFRFYENFCISIHAPAKGATTFIASPYFSQTISIHAPAKGATVFLFRYTSYIQFQSTLPRRERQGVLPVCSLIGIFQSTLPRRERLIIQPSETTCIKFQSTLPRRERHGRILFKG